MLPQLANLSLKPIFLPFIFLLSAFLITVLFLPFYIAQLKRLQIGQFIREEGPASHAVKAKTPTSGGVVFMLALLFNFVLNCAVTHRIDTLGLAVIATATFCGLLGLADDLTKILNRANKGLSAAQRLLSEMVLGAIFALLLIYIQPQTKEIIINVSNSAGILTSHFFALPWWAFVGISIFLVAATSNSVNLNDGMDGLAAGLALPIFLTLSIMLVATHHFALALIAMSCVGTLSAFLLFNCYPAKVFMGDTGSLFIGGLLATLILASGLIVWFIPLALIYILETASVMLQVSYFKLTKPYMPPKPKSQLSIAWYKLTHKLPGEGRRIFRMSPLHHHFEAVFSEKGMEEWQVVLGFWLAQCLICALVMAAFIRF